MAFCSFAREYKKNNFTSVESKFISQFMPESDGTAVKVYLYGLLLCQTPDSPLEPSDISRFLSIDDEKLLDCFLYWEDFGLVNVLCRSPLNVEYLPVDSAYKHKRAASHKYETFVKEVQLLISERMITPNEFNEYFSILDAGLMSPEAMILVIKYCVDMKGKKINYKYITTVIKNYADRGITTFEQVEEELSGYMTGGELLSNVFKALKKTGKPELSDQLLLKKWQKELAFDENGILTAASKVKSGGMKALDNLLSELYVNKRFSENEILSFVKEKDKLYEFAYSIINMFRLGSVAIEPYMANYFSPWFAKGYDMKSIELVATYCFKRNKRSLEDVNSVIESLFQKGVIAFDSIAEYFNTIALEDKFIASYLEILGINRRPNSWDRECLANWRGWFFSDEMILEAAKRSSGTSNPIPYMNAVLSRWKNSGIFSTEKIDSYNKPSLKQDDGHMHKRNYSAEDIAEILEKMEDIEI